MPYTAIKGTFHVVNYSPDGDSIRFQPDDLTLVKKLGGRPSINKRQHVQLRLEGIDTLETHYTPPGDTGIYHQPQRWAQAALERLLGFVDIQNIVWDSARRTVLTATDGTAGYILSRGVDKYGRPIAFVYAGNPGFADGSDVVLDPTGLHASYNFQALQEGLAYPTFYSQLFADLRNELSNAAASARAAATGLWPDDGTTSGIHADNLGVITESTPLMPKLFRRLVEHMAKTGSAVGFREVMVQSQEPVLDLVTSNFTHFDTFIDQAPGSVDIRLTRKPEELVFDPMPLRPADHFARLLANLDPASDAGPGNTQPRATFAGEWASA